MTHKRHFDLYVCSCSEDGGLVRVSLDSETGELEMISKIPLDRPMYAIKRDGELLVITREGGEGNFGALVRFAVNEDGELSQIGEKLDTGGIVPCHLDSAGEDIYVVNYLSGNVRRMGGRTVFHAGRGPHPTRQEAPHTHCVKIAPDANVIVTDLGLDTVFVYSRELRLLSSAKVPDGYGARHLAFSEDGKTLFCVNELVSSVTVFDYNGALTPLGTYKAAPNMEGNTAAAIRLVGNELFVSNRGHDSIAVFSVDGTKLALKKYIKTYGEEPRDFDVFGRFIVSANQKSNAVCVIDKETGELVCALGVKEPLCVTEI